MSEEERTAVDEAWFAGITARHKAIVAYLERRLIKTNSELVRTELLTILDDLQSNNLWDTKEDELTSESDEE